MDERSPARTCGSRRRSRPRRRGSLAPRSLLLAIALLAVVVAACAPGSGGPTASPGMVPEGALLHYARAWPDGLVESQTIWADGRVEMLHGEHRERFTLPAPDIDRLRVALEDVPTGTPTDSPRRTLWLADGRVIESPSGGSGTLTELLDGLIDTHRLPG